MSRLCLALSTAIWSASLCRAFEPVHPEPISKCLTRIQLPGLSVMTDINPYYLRGDFDGDRRPDYALGLRLKTGGIGLMICTGRGAVFVLGSGIGMARFSDAPEDRFLAPHWEVLTKREAAELTAWSHNVPPPIPAAKGESIAMVWEDGICLIYWDGRKFRWAGSKE